MIFYTRNQTIKDNACAEIQRLNGTWKIQISRPKRTNKQNAYLHSLIDIIAKEIGYSSEEMKEILKLKFLGLKQVQLHGKTYDIPIPSSSLETPQFALLLEKTIALAHELNINIPPPTYYGY